MKVSKLIEELEKIRDDCGDLNIYVYDRYDQPNNIQSFIFGRFKNDPGVILSAFDVNVSEDNYEDI